MTDAQCIHNQLNKIRDAIACIEQLSCIQPMRIQDKANYYEKLSEMDRAVDTLMDMTARLF